METGAWIAGLPKVELHVHLEGALWPETMLALAARNGVTLDAETPDELAGLYRFDGFDDFARLFLAGLGVLRTAADFADATAALAERLAGQNVRYAEVTTTPVAHFGRGVAPEEYVAGLDEGRRRAGRLGVVIGWICDIPRMEIPDSHLTIDFLVGGGAPDGVVGLGLGGPEAGYPPEPFAGSFAKARAHGLAALPHAGETAGAESIWGAVNALHADRVAHGVRCLDDPALVAHLAERRIPLDVAPTSNVVLRVVPDAAAHPLGALRDAGLVVTINTDDPAYFSTDLGRELRLAHDLHGFTRRALLDAQSAALAASYAPAPVRAAIGRELAGVRAATEAG